MNAPLVISRDQIDSLICEEKLFDQLAESFVALSEGQANIPPVGFLALPKGETHIKFGHIKNSKYFVVKVASGFFENPKFGLSSSQGCMLVFCANTGKLLGNIHDHGYLTDLRTAMTGALVAKLLAPKKLQSIGIVGSGTQAKLQLKFLARITKCRSVKIWARSPQKLKKILADPILKDFSIKSSSIEDLGKNCQLIVTTTPSKSPLLFAEHIKNGTHISAVGADDKDKQEIDESLLERADVLVGDYLAQCQQFGELSRTKKNAFELGNIIKHKISLSEKTISIADLTGVATQDIVIASHVYEAALKK